MIKRFFEIIGKVNELLNNKEKKQFFLLLIFTFVVTVFEIVGIGAIPLFIGVLTSPDVILGSEYIKVLSPFINLQNSRDLLIFGAAFLLVSNVTKNLVTFGFYYYEAIVLYDAYSRMSTRLFRSYMNAPYSFHLRRNSAEIIRNTYIETKYIVTSTMVSLLGIAFNVVLLLGVFCFLLFMSPVVTLILTVSLGASSAFVLIKLRKATERYGNLAQRNRGKIIEHVQMSVGAIKSLLLSNRQETLVGQYEKVIVDFSQTFKFSKILVKSTKPFVEVLTITILLATSVAMLWMGYAFNAILATLTLFASAAIRLIPSIRELLAQITDLNYHKNSLDPVLSDLRETAEDNVKTNGHKIEDITFNNTIEIKNVYFKYSPDKDFVLDNINLKFHRGQNIGIVGPSGSGKSTLIDVLLGLLKPEKGEVLIDDKNINLNLQGWTKRIGYIPQHIYICNDSVKRNIALGVDNNEIDETRIWESIKGAQLLSVIEKLPDGIDTNLGEGGNKLSGGQRQRIGIARALYHNPDIIIMDEATSALDNSTEMLFLNSLDEIRKNKTLITVAHRLSTIKHCDVIFYMENGYILAVGSYDELLAKSDKFKEMAMTRNIITAVKVV